MGIFDLTGRNAFVTGGAQGIGRAIAIGLASHGAYVAIADINDDGAASTAAAIEADGGGAVAVRCDVSDERSVEAAVSEAANVLGPLTILVNDAFVPPLRERPQDFPLENFKRVLDVNLAGYFLCAKAIGGRLIAAGLGGSVINVSSIAATSGMGRGNFVYSIGKAGVHQLTKELAVEWGRQGIRVNAIQPCQTRTPGLQALLDDPAFDGDALIERFLVGIPIGRIAEPGDFVGAAVFLASDASAMVTGVSLPVDGGNLAMNAGGSHTW